MRHKATATMVALGMTLSVGLFVAAGSYESNTNAYFDGRQLRINFKEVEPATAAAVIARNSPLYSVYSAEGCEPEGRAFVKVIDRIEGDGTSTLWRVVQIEFNPGYPCRQFTSDEQIEIAVKSGEISLTPTGYVYRCRLVGSDK